MASVKSKNVDMLNGKLGMKLIMFALPLAMASLLQQLFNSADVAIVGRFAGNDALAAVGANVANVGLYVNLIVGFSAGPNVLLANYLGQERKKEISDIVHTIVGFAITAGLVLLLIGQLLARPMIGWTNTPVDVLDQAELYLRIYLVCIPFIVFYNFGSAILRSVGDTKRPLYIMVVSGVVNVLLNLLFVIKFNMSVAGVALATLIANILSALIIFVLLIREEGLLHLSVRKICLKPVFVRKLFQIGIPSGLQGMVFSLSNLFIQTSINGLGSIVVAGSSAALNFEYFTYDISSAFAQATVTFTGQNYGAGKIDRCRRIYILTFAQGLLFTQLLCLIFTIWAYPFAGLYSADPVVVKIAVSRMLRVMAFEGLTATYEVSASAMRSMGSYVAPAVMTLLGTVGFRILWIYTVFKYFGTFESLMLVYPASWVLTGTMLIVAYIFKMRSVSMNN